MRVSRSIRRAWLGSKKGFISMLGLVHKSRVEAVWVPAGPKAIPKAEPNRVMVTTYVEINVKRIRFLAPRVLIMVSS